MLLVLAGEKRWASELSLQRASGELLAGLAAGACLMGLVYGALVLSGLYHFQAGSGLNWPIQIFHNLATALVEELVFRAIIFRLLDRAFGVKLALILSALLFGGMHLLNPNASPEAALAIAIEAGLMLAAFLLLTGRIWLPVGVHAAWNFTEGPLFGAPVSGFSRSGTWLVSVPQQGSSEVLSGGQFGPEASIPAMLIGGCAFIILLLLMQHQHGERQKGTAIS
ncbi:MAG: CPBP family intramembrane glutamic endopeptidase [Caulobacteraceae bacterium]